jgi:hypothetical protein
MALESLISWMIAAVICAAIVPGPPREAYGAAKA